MRKPWVLATVLTFSVWMFLSRYWFNLLDGDAALYPLMSVEVLRGNHFFYTIGQSHGGTPLVYLRAALFKPFLDSQWQNILPQLGIIFTGSIAAIAVGLWTHFCTRITRVLTCSSFLAPSANSFENLQIEKSAGRTAGYSFGLCAAFGSAIFAQYSTTDYYVLALVMGGLLLNVSLSLAERAEVSRLQSFLFGVLVGFGFYICRFTPLYAIAAVGAFLMHSSAVRAALFIPSLKELTKKRTLRGKISKVGFYALLVNSILVLLAFFSNDHFLGVDAESALKTSAKIGLALWLLHRGRILIESPLKAGFGAFGFALGLAPHIYFKTHFPMALDRTTGLVRWNNLSNHGTDLIRNLGLFFSRQYPTSLGISCIAAGIVLFGIAVVRRRPQTKQLKWLLWSIVFFGLAFASWLLVHTYMHAVPQYFYPAYFPFLLMVAISASVLWKRNFADKTIVIISMALLLTTSILDLRYISQQKNIRMTSQIFETLDQWTQEGSLATAVVTGDYWSTYDLMWAQYARPAGAKIYTFSPLFASRYQKWHDKIVEAKTLAYVFHNGDGIPIELKNFQTIKSVKLANEYRLDLLQQ